MLLHAREAEAMCATFNHMDFGNVSVFHADGAALSFLLASIGSKSFGNLKS
jgi:hypothetical protein